MGKEGVLTPICLDLGLQMVDKKRNGGPRNLKTILKREKKARERNSAHGSRRRKPQHPVCLRNSHPETVNAFEQIKM